MKVRHLRSQGIWLLSRGNRILYRSEVSPWRSPGIIEAALRRDGKRPRPPTLDRVA